MYILKNRKYRAGIAMTLSLFLIIAGSWIEPGKYFMTSGVYRKEQKQIYAWWGTIYPEFCFAKVKKDEKSDDSRKPEIKLWIVSLFQ